MPEPDRAGEKVLRGIPVSAGVCRGKIVVLGRSQHDAVPQYSIGESEMPGQLARLEKALALTRQQIREVQRQVTEKMGAGEATIFEAHLLVLEDPTLIEEVTRCIEKNRVNVEHAFSTVAENYAKTLSAMDDEYLRERAADMRDVSGRILNNLLGRHDDSLRHITEPSIIISHDLSPSTTAQLDRKMILGFATDVGSKTSHTAIMARAMRIPAVVGLKDATKKLTSGQYVMLDGYNGFVIVNPTDQSLFEYGQLVRKQDVLEEKLRDVREKPAVTLDGTRIMLSANVEQVSDTDAVTAGGAEGVGLFRSEFLFINRQSMPTEEEQYQAYRQVAAALKPQPVVIRTLDLGGDKFFSQLEVPQEMNPFLGWRAIRFCLQERDIFCAQLRAILRAAVEGNVKIMYPMISGLDELKQANAVLEECKQQLREAGIPHDAAIEVGAMIEIPSAVIIADALAKHVKFFSLGTNDLIQYTLAVDRLNERIAHLYEPTHPAILRLIKATVDAGHRAGIWVGVCGEMASDPTLVPILLGLGVDELSATPSLVPQIKFLIRRLKMPEVKALAEFALNCESGAEILARSQALAKESAPSLFENL
jgi:phosphotransferase system enzyme I (PtsI)